MSHPLALAAGFDSAWHERAQQPQSRAAAGAQKPEPPAQQNLPPGDSQDVVKITTNLVQFDVSVTKDGKPVTDLQPEDFEIFEDGKPQTINICLNGNYGFDNPREKYPKPSRLRVTAFQPAAEFSC
jgi:hypothetical protein